MKPVLQALVLAERVYEDRSGKKIICGTFDQLVIGQVPKKTREHPDGRKTSMVPGGTDPGCPSAYISLTDVVDGTEITLQFFNQTKNAAIMGTGFRIEKADRLATIELVAPLPPLSSFVKEAGTYSLDVLWKGEILGSHRVRVVEAEGPEEE